MLKFWGQGRGRVGRTVRREGGKGRGVGGGGLRGKEGKEWRRREGENWRGW